MNSDEYIKDVQSALKDLFDDDLIQSMIEAIEAVSTHYEITSNTVNNEFNMEEEKRILDLYIHTLMLENKAKTTIHLKNCIITYFLEEMKIPISHVTSDHIQSFISHYSLKHKIAEKTLRNYRTDLGLYYHWLYLEGYRSTDLQFQYGSIVKSHKEIIALTEDELSQLRNACKDIREKAVLEFLYSTAARRTEAANIKISDIDFNEGTVKLKGKGLKERTSYLTKKCIQYLEEYLGNRKGDSEYVFFSSLDPYQPLHGNQIYRIILHIASRTAINKTITPHTIRRTTATLALKRGMSLEHVQVLLGHDDIEVTIKHYTKIYDEDIKKAHQLYVR